MLNICRFVILLEYDIFLRFYSIKFFQIFARATNVFFLNLFRALKIFLGILFLILLFFLHERKLQHGHHGLNRLNTTVIFVLQFVYVYNLQFMYIYVVLLLVGMNKKNGINLDPVCVVRLITYKTYTCALWEPKQYTKYSPCKCLQYIYRP